MALSCPDYTLLSVYAHARGLFISERGCFMKSVQQEFPLLCKIKESIDPNQTIENFTSKQKKQFKQEIEKLKIAEKAIVNFTIKLADVLTPIFQSLTLTLQSLSKSLTEIVNILYEEANDKIQ